MLIACLYLVIGSAWIFSTHTALGGALHLHFAGMHLAWALDAVFLLSSCILLFAIVRRAFIRSRGYERDLQESRERYRQLVELAPMAITVHDGEHFLLANAAACELFGYGSTDSMHGLSVARHMHPDYLEIAQSRIHSALEDGVCAPLSDQKIVRADGTSLDVSTLAVPMDSRDGRVVMTMMRDISKRKEAEAELRENQALFHRMAQTSPFGILICQDGLCTYANAAACRLTGYDGRELPSSDPALLFHPDHRELAMALVASPSGQSKNAYPSEVMVLSKDGGLRWSEMSVSQFRFEGRPATMVILQDVTGRKSADKVQNAIYKISEAAQNTDGLQQFFKATHEIICTLMDARNFRIARFDREKGLLEFLYWVDEKEPPPQGFVPPDKGLTEYVLKTRTPLLANPEVFHRLREAGEVATTGTASIDWLGVPLKVKGDAIGALTVQTYKDGARYTEDDKNILVFVSSQVAMAVERHRAQEAGTQRSQAMIRQQWALLKIAKLKTGNLSQGLRTITEIATETLGVDRMSLWIFASGLKEIVCLDYFESGNGAHSSGQRLVVSSFPRYFKALEESHTIAVTDAQQDARTSEFRDSYLKPLGITSMLDVPIRMRGAVAGVLRHEQRGPGRRWSLEDQSFAVAVADLVALSIEASEHRKANEELRRRDRLLKAVAGASSALLTSRDYDDTINAALEDLGRADRVDRVHIFVNHDHPVTGEPVTSRRYEWAGPEVESQIDNSALQSLSLRTGAFREWYPALTQGYPVHADRKHSSKDVSGYMAGQGIQSLLLVPIMIEGRCWGFLGLDACRVARRWTANEESILLSAAGGIGGAIYRRRAERTIAESESRFRTQAEATSAAIVIYRNDQILYINPAAEAMTGLSLQECKSLQLLDLVHPAYRALVAARREQQERAPEIASRYEFKIITSSGEERWIEASGGPIYYDGKPAVLVTGFDITDRKRAEDLLLVQTSYFQQLFEGSPEAIVVLDESEKILQANPGFEKLFGYAAGDITGKPINELIVPADQMAEASELSRRVLDKEVIETEAFRTRSDGTLVPVSILGYPIVLAGRQTGVYGIYRDITEQKRLVESLYDLAHFDALTGLPNRTFFYERLRDSLGQGGANANRSAVILLDVDRFKEVNEALGHEMGDYLLKGIAERLLRSLGARATIARMGSDEFVVLLQEAESPESASSVAAWIFEAFRKPFRVAGQEITINLSMGISLCPNDGLTTGSLLRHADIALNRVKSEGGDGFHFFRSEMDSEASERLTMRHELRMAIERREFLAHYQPVIDMQSGRIAAMESLVRWRHPEKGILSPARFIPIAEETGLIVDIGQWIMTTACAQNRFWQGLGHHALRVSVNLSGRQFREKNIIDVVSRALDQTGIEPSCLEVEITESTAMWDLEKTIDILHRMADLGIRIAIDDFGKGYSSFYYLKSFPIHTLKIDRAFIADVTSSPNDAAIVRSIITMAHGLNLRVVAEGVETEEQFYFLKQNGCDAAQGFFFSKPMPGDDFLPFLNNWSDLH